MRVFIIMYNRLTWPLAMCEYLSDTGCEVVLVDNASTYPPLLEWYKNCPYKLIRMDKNWGHQVVWKSGLINDYDDEFYCVTDHDLDLSNIPVDYINVLHKGLEAFPDVVKSGFSLEINDLPSNKFTKEVVNWENKFWQSSQKGIYLHSNIDTTFALYDKKRDFGPLPPEGNRFYWAARSARPYTAKHLPWYITKENMNEEEQFYQDNTHTYWSQKLKESWM